MSTGRSSPAISCTSARSPTAPTKPGTPASPSVVINDPNVKVDFVFQLVNAGNASSDTVEAALLGTAEQLIGIGASSAGPSVVSSILSAIPASGPWELALKGVAKLWDWLTTDCDGPVAVDHLSGARFAIDTWADDDPSRHDLCNREGLRRHRLTVGLRFQLRLSRYLVRAALARMERGPEYRQQRARLGDQRLGRIAQRCSARLRSSPWLRGHPLQNIQRRELAGQPARWVRAR